MELCQYVFQLISFHRKQIIFRLLVSAGNFVARTLLLLHWRERHSCEKIKQNSTKKQNLIIKLIQTINIFFLT